MQNQPVKQTAELRVLVYPAEAIPATTGRDLGVADEARDLIFKAAGDAKDILSKGGFDHAADWESQLTIIAGERLDFFHMNGKLTRGIAAAPLAKSGSGSSGFYLKTTVSPRNNRIEEAPKGITVARGRAPKGGNFAPIRWRHVRGLARQSYDANGNSIKVSAWITSIPDRLPRRTFVFHEKQVADGVTEIESFDVFPALQQTRWELIGLAEARDNKNAGGIRLMWGNRANSLELRRGGFPTLCRAKPDAAGDDEEWEIVERITDWGKVEFAGDLTVTVENLNGHIGISLADGQGKGGSWDFPARRVVPGDPSRGVPHKYQSIPWTWPKGALGYSAQGVGCHIGVSLLELSQETKTPTKTRDKKGRNITETKTRRGPLRDGYQRAPQMLAPGSPPPMGGSAIVAAGFFPPGTSATVTANVTTVGEGADAKTTVDYSCELQSNLVVSPVVSRVCGKHKGVPTLDDFEPLDVSGQLVGSPHESGIALGSMSSKEFTFELDRFLLERANQNAARPWTDYVAKDNPVTIEARWRLSDGSFTEWSGRLAGYIVSDEKSTSGACDWGLAIVARDPLHRLTDPAGMVDETDAPLEFLLLENDGNPLTGAQMAAEVVASKLGRAEADRINGGGADRFSRFYEDDHPALLRGDGGISLKALDLVLSGSASNGFLFPPPYNRDALSWLEDLAGQDFATFYYGFVPPVEGQPPQKWPCLIWGELGRITAGRPRHVLADAVYEPGDEERLILELRTAQKPEKRYNTIKVWSNPQGQTPANLPFPAVVMAEAKLPRDDPNSAERSWPRTEIIENAALFPSDWAQMTADQIIRGLVGLDVEWPRLTIRGAGEIQEGDEVTPKMLYRLPADGETPDLFDVQGADGLIPSRRGQSDLMVLSGDSFRVIHAEQRFDLDAHNWVSELEVFPLSLWERMEENNG